MPNTDTHPDENSNRWTDEKVISIQRWTPSLLSFRTTRPPSFTFTPGHYARLGLGADDAVIWRPYSLASAASDEFLEFIAILVPGGGFSHHLETLQVGDAVRVDKQCFGFLIVNQLAAGKDLWLLASGTGIGPFVSILLDPTVWRDFEHLILVHSVRQASELAYREEIAALPLRMSIPAGQAQLPARLSYIPIVTRQPGASAFSARIPALLSDGRLEQAAGTPLTVEASRVMACGNPEMTRELREILSQRGFATNRRSVPGQMAFEKYW